MLPRPCSSVATLAAAPLASRQCPVGLLVAEDANAMAVVADDAKAMAVRAHHDEMLAQPLPVRERGMKEGGVGSYGAQDVLGRRRVGSVLSGRWLLRFLATWEAAGTR